MNSSLNQFSGAAIFQTSSCGSNKAGKLIRWDLTSRCASITETSASRDDCIIFNIYAINVQFVSWKMTGNNNVKFQSHPLRPNNARVCVRARTRSKKRAELWLIRALIVFDEAITLQRCTPDCFHCRERNMTVATGCNISLKERERNEFQYAFIKITLLLWPRLTACAGGVRLSSRAKFMANIKLGMTSNYGYQNISQFHKKKTFL